MLNSNLQDAVQLLSLVQTQLSLNPSLANSKQCCQLLLEFVNNDNDEIVETALRALVPVGGTIPTVKHLEQAFQITLLKQLKRSSSDSVVKLAVRYNKKKYIYIINYSTFGPIA